MTIKPDIPDRRALLNALLALPVLGVSAAPAAGAAPSTAAHLTTAFFSRRHSAAVLGQAYLLQRPEEASVDRLEALLLSRRNLELLSEAGVAGGDLGATRPQELKKAFQALRRRDFDDGEVLQIDGCMLSVTELRLCALMALT